jgi:hypothetical protein
MALRSCCRISINQTGHACWPTCPVYTEHEVAGPIEVIVPIVLHRISWGFQHVHRGTVFTVLHNSRPHGRWHTLIVTQRIGREMTTTSFVGKDLKIHVDWIVTHISWHREPAWTEFEKHDVKSEVTKILHEIQSSSTDTPTEETRL